MGACAFSHLVLRGSKPWNSLYPEELITLGDHLRKKRLDRNKSQPQVAYELKVDVESILAWEHNKNTPTPKYASRVIKFIGYFPFDCSNESLKRLVLYARMVAGHSLKQMASEVGLDSSTISGICSDKSRNSMNNLVKIKNYINSYLNI